jgi:hypothetical protein
MRSLVISEKPVRNPMLLPETSQARKDIIFIVEGRKIPRLGLLLASFSGLPDAPQCNDGGAGGRATIEGVATTC